MSADSHDLIRVHGARVNNLALRPGAAALALPLSSPIDTARCDLSGSEAMESERIRRAAGESELFASARPADVEVLP